MKTLQPPDILRQSWGNSVFFFIYPTAAPCIFRNVDKWKKRSSKQYCFNNNLGILHVCVVSWIFFTRFVTIYWFPKRWVNIQTHAKPYSPQNIPKTVPERPSRLIISVTFDDFYRINQTFWCSTVGVSLIEIHTKVNFLKLFSKRYCIDSTFIFRKVS